MYNPLKRLAAAFLCVYIFTCAFATAAGASADYSGLDARVKNTPDGAASSVKSLAGYLEGLCSSDTEKARAIFDWIVLNIGYDWEAALTSDLSGQTPEKVLKNRKGVCGGYAYLFAALADAMKLKHTTIPGVSKGINYLIGQQATKSNHVWNAVWIDGEWKLIDCAWGAGYVDDNGKFVRQRSDYYFMTPPDQFIYNHFPDDQKWQLLSNSVTRDDYENMVLVRPEFFGYGLNLISHPRVHISSGAKVKITLGAPDDVVVVADVLPSSGKKAAPVSGTSTLVQRSDKGLDVNASFPSSGKYILRLFARHKGEKANCVWVADYSIDASAGASVGAGFPNAYPVFQERNACLIAPLRNSLTSGMTETFSLTVPGAEDVAIVAGTKLVKLERNGDTFRGKAPISGSKVSVAARFPGRDDYSVLVDYQVTGQTASSDP